MSRENRLGPSSRVPLAARRAAHPAVDAAPAPVAVLPLRQYGSLRAETREVFQEAFAPPSAVTVDEWADAHRYVSPESSSMPGRWRTNLVPFAREIMQALTDPDVHHVVLMKSAQVCGTEIINNWVGHTMDCAPAPFLVVQPTLGMMRTWSKDRLEPMLRDTPTLVGKVRDGSRRRESENTIERKVFPGGYVAAITAGSTASLRMRACGKIAADDRDEWEFDLSEQGDPFDLLVNRATTFWDWKVFEVSTPLDWYTSRIFASLRKSDWRRFFVPCPSCNAEQPLVWRDGEGEDETPEGGERYRLVCERDAGGDLVAESARYQCAHCDHLIEERWKPAMLEAGRWIPKYPGRERRGYHLNALYSPVYTWARMMGEFLDVKDNPVRLKGFVNGRVGLPFKFTGETVKPHALKERAEDYGDNVDVPRGVGVVVAGVDVQVDRLEVGLWGYGANEEAWVLRQDQLEGDPAQDAVWHLLAEYLQHEWRLVSGRRIRIGAMAIDAGYQPDRVHRFCHQVHRADRPVFATVGREGRGRPILTAPSLAVKWKKARGERHQSHLLGTDSAKDRLAQLLRIAESGPGYIHFPQFLDTVFYEQLTAEELKVAYVNGHPTRRWILPPGRRNEALDCANGAYAALLKLGTAVIQQLGAWAEALAGDGSGLPVARGRRIRSSGVER